jgi:hypothetical protein
MRNHLTEGIIFSFLRITFYLIYLPKINQSLTQNSSVSLYQKQSRPKIKQKPCSWLINLPLKNRSWRAGGVCGSVVGCLPSMCNLQHCPKKKKKKKSQEVDSQLFLELLLFKHQWEPSYWMTQEYSGGYLGFWNQYLLYWNYKLKTPQLKFFYRSS